MAWPRMVDKSLAQQLEQPAAETRFLTLSTIREYAVERLAESGEESATRRAHAAYYVVLAEECGGELSTHPEWLERFDLEQPNFREALEFLIRTGDAEWGMRLASALFHFWELGSTLLKVARFWRGSSNCRERTQPKICARLLFYAADFRNRARGFLFRPEIARGKSEKPAASCKIAVESPSHSMLWVLLPAIVEISQLHVHSSSSASRLGENWAVPLTPLVRLAIWQMWSGYREISRVPQFCMKNV